MIISHVFHCTLYHRSYLIISHTRHKNLGNCIEHLLLFLITITAIISSWPRMMIISHCSSILFRVYPAWVMYGGYGLYAAWRWVHNWAACLKTTFTPLTTSHGDPRSCGDTVMRQQPVIGDPQNRWFLGHVIDDPLTRLWGWTVILGYVAVFFHHAMILF